MAANSTRLETVSRRLKSSGIFFPNSEKGPINLGWRTVSSNWSNLDLNSENELPIAEYLIIFWI